MLHAILPFHHTKINLVEEVEISLYASKGSLRFYIGLREMSCKAKKGWYNEKAGHTGKLGTQSAVILVTT